MQLSYNLNFPTINSVDSSTVKNDWHLFYVPFQFRVLMFSRSDVELSSCMGRMIRDVFLLVGPLLHPSPANRGAASVYRRASHYHGWYFASWAVYTLMQLADNGHISISPRNNEYRNTRQSAQTCLYVIVLAGMLIVRRVAGRRQNEYRFFFDAPCLLTGVRDRTDSVKPGYDNADSAVNQRARRRSWEGVPAPNFCSDWGLRVIYSSLLATKIHRIRYITNK